MSMEEFYCGNAFATATSCRLRTGELSAWGLTRNFPHSELRVSLLGSGPGIEASELRRSFHLRDKMGCPSNLSWRR